MQKNQQAQSLVAYVNADILDKNEVREELGYEPRPEEAAAPPPPPVVMDTSTPVAQDEPAVKSHTHVRTEPGSLTVADLARWQTVATNRLREGKATKALAFESKVIRPSLMASIQGALETVKSVTDIKHIFADAIEWAAYP